MDVPFANRWVAFASFTAILDVLTLEKCTRVGAVQDSGNSQPMVVLRACAIHQM